MVVLEQTLTVVLGLNLPSFPDLRDTMHRGLLLCRHHRQFSSVLAYRQQTDRRAVEHWSPSLRLIL